MRPLQQFRCSVALVLITGCQGWRTVTPNPEVYVKEHTPDRIRVTRHDSSRLEIRAPQVRSDSLVGTTGGGLARGDTIRMVGVPLSEVSQVEARQGDAGKTLALVALITVSFLAVAAAGLNSGPGPHY